MDSVVMNPIVNPMYVVPTRNKNVILYWECLFFKCDSKGLSVNIFVEENCFFLRIQSIIMISNSMPVFNSIENKPRTI